MPSSRKLSFVYLNLSFYQLQYEKNLSNCAAEQSKYNPTILAGSLINPSFTRLFNLTDEKKHTINI